MKKFLLILLIAVAASIKIEFDDAELNGWFKKLVKKVKNIGKKVWDFVKKIPQKLMKIVDWLKAHGLWDKLMDYVEKFGAAKATAYCVSVAPLILKALCAPAINEIIKHLRK